VCVCVVEGKDSPGKTLMEMFLSLRLKYVILLMTLEATLSLQTAEGLFIQSPCLNEGVCVCEREREHPLVQV